MDRIEDATDHRKPCHIYWVTSSFECNRSCLNVRDTCLELGWYNTPPLHFKCWLSVKESGFSPKPYSSHFIFISFYSSQFSFMQAFTISQSVLWLYSFTGVWLCDLSSFLRDWASLSVSISTLSPVSAIRRDLNEGVMTSWEPMGVIYAFICD